MCMISRGTRTALRVAADARGLDVIIRDNGHVQFVGGDYLVNYYPTSRNRTAYVAGAARGIHNVSPEQAAELAFTGGALLR